MSDTPVNNEYYIVVKKEKGTFNILNTKAGITDSTSSPESIINSQADSTFPIKVVQGDNTKYSNEFDVDGVKYSLDLKTAFDNYNVNGKLIDDKNFSAVHKAFNPSAPANPASPPTTSSNTAPTAPTISSTLSDIIKTSTNYDDFIQKVNNNETLFNLKIDSSDIEKLTGTDNQTPIKDFVVFTSDYGDSLMVGLPNQKQFKFNRLGSNNTDLYLYKFDRSVHQGGQKQKQRRSKRNYSKKQRKQWAKNNTLRNYL